MRDFTPILALVCLLFPYLSTANAVTLSQYQEINGFSQACVNAYNTPLSGCTASEITGRSCSTTCIAFLEALTKIINDACGGGGAMPDTLIGAFFSNRGTALMCPNVLGGNGGASDGSSMQGGNENTYTSNTYPYVLSTASTSSADMMPLLSAASTISTSEISFSSTANAASITTSVAVVDKTIAAPTTTSVAIVDKTIAPQTPSNLMSFTPSTDTSHARSAPTTSQSTSRAASAQSDSSGGTLLDVGSDSAASHGVKNVAWILVLLAGSAGLLLLL